MIAPAFRALFTDRGRRWWALIAVSLATFLIGLDNSVVNVALPTLQRALGLGMSDLEWVFSGYVLTYAGLMLVGGRLADIHGSGLVFRVGLAVFTAASLLAGLSPTGSALIASRSVQGLGAALLAPAALSTLQATFVDERERARAIALWGAVGALALAVGPVTGGWIAETWGWSWIFLVNVPPGLIAYAVASFAIPAAGTGRLRRSLDLPGLSSSATALVGLSYALIEGPDRGWTSPVVLGSLVAAVLGAVAFVATEARVTDPMIDLSLFTKRAFAGGTLVLGLWAFAVFGVYFFTALYLQNVVGLSPTASGAAFVPMALVTAIAAVAAERVSARRGTAQVVSTGLAVMATAMLGLAVQGSTRTLAAVMPWLLTYGAGAGLLLPVNAAVVREMPLTRAGAASGVLNASREVFGLLGVVVLGAALSARETKLVAMGYQSEPAFVAGYQLALTVAAAVLAAGVPVSLCTLSGAGSDRTLSS